jgi:hypothetical protein
MNTHKESVPVLDKDGEMVYDENGIYVTEEIEYSSCPSCEYESMMRLDYVNEEGPEAEQVLNSEIKKYKETNPIFKPHRINGDLIRELMEYHRDTDADELPRKAMAQYQIASSLMNAISANEKGKILPNLGFWWSDPSGSGKTPLLTSGVDDFMEDVFKGHIRYETGTAKGMMRSLARFYKDAPDEKKNILITWDEAQNILTMLKENALADIYSFMCQLIDNKLQSYITIARGEERFPPLTANIWLSGVPEMIEKSPKSFWFQGAGNRFLFVKTKKFIIKDIRRVNETHTDHRRHLIDELKLLHKIRYVEYSDEFLDEYNKYRRDILESIANIQTDMSSSQDIDNYDVLSKMKYPVLVWKLSIIYAASRGNFNDELLKMDVEDLENAKADLEIYHENVMTIFNYWLEKATKDAELRSSDRFKKKFERAIQTILRNPENRWEVYVEDKENGEPAILAMKSKEGTWVSHSMLLMYSNLVLKDFTEAVDTLHSQESLRISEAIFSRDGSRIPKELSAVGRVSKFYKWNPDAKKKNSPNS